MMTLLLRRLLKIAAAVQIMVATNCLFADVPLTKEGKPVAEILIDAQADEVVIFAAEELQLWTEKISGAKLPIVNETGNFTSRVVLGVMGACKVLGDIPNQFPDDVEKLQGNDGYAVRTVNGNVYLFASQPKGVLNGIFRLLFRNTDLIWARPNTDFGTIYSENPDLAFAQTDYLDVPAYVLRGWQMIGNRTHKPSEMWQIRNGVNWSTWMTGNPDYRKHGMVLEYGGGHNLVGLYITEKKYFDTHPDFFVMKEGKRIPPSSHRHKTQLCFTNPEMTKAFIKELDARIQKNPQYTTYRIMIEDNWVQCECPQCLKPLDLPDGTTLEYTADKASPFRSTQFFMWLNQIADHMLKNYPGKRILTFGYFFTAVPPKVEVAPNISISFCPITKNSKERLTGQSNADWHKRFLDWMQITNQLTWREYFGLVGPFPRPMDVIALDDLKLVNKYGINRTYSELYSDTPGTRMDGPKSWAMNAMYFWTMTNGLWNPNQNVYDMRQEFLKRVYGAGAQDVAEFYRIIEKSWFETPGFSRWNDSAFANWRIHVIKKELTESCRAALERAAAKVTHPNGQKMLEALRSVFEESVASFDNMSWKGSAKKVSKAPAFDPHFALSDWAETEPLKDFCDYRTGAEFAEETAVRVLYDNENIYFGVKCYDRDAASIHNLPAGQLHDKWPVGDKFELFLTGKTEADALHYYQFVYDSNGNRFDAKNGKHSWNGDWSVVTASNNEGWSSLITIPWKNLGWSDVAEVPSAFDAMFLRYVDQKSYTDIGSWFGGRAQNPATFCPIELQ